MLIYLIILYIVKINRTKFTLLNNIVVVNNNNNNIMVVPDPLRLLLLREYRGGWR